MGVSIALIKKINGIGNDDFLYPGRKIKLVENAEPEAPPAQTNESESLKIPKDPLVDPSTGRPRSKSTVDE
jgi:LysM repeat protein